MYISNLRLQNFRNYRQGDLPLSSGITLLYGPNAAGKTSLLESLFYLATTRSPRVGADRELVRWGTRAEAGAPPFARLLAEVQRATSTVQLEVIIQWKSTDGTRDDVPAPETTSTGTTQKIIRINRRPARALDLVGQLRVVLFTPADLVLVEGPPGARRRYLDITLSQLDPHYVRTLSHYQKMVQQRNSLLRAWREQRRPRRAIDAELGYWDNEIAANGAYILAERLRAIADLNQQVGPLFRRIAGGEEPLEIQYQPSFEPGSAQANPHDVGGIASQMTDSLHRLRNDELARGQTLIGPHRDDLLFTVGPVNLGVYGSRGQQRSVALALKLGEADFMQARSGERPVLLLDDLLSELDMQRRGHVLQTIKRPDQQTLLTATDLSHFDAAFLQQAHCLRVEDGSLYPG